MQEQPNHSIPSWLQKLQENSWEVELLISGGAVYSLLQLSSYLQQTLYTIRITSAIVGSNEFYILLMLSIQMLTVGFFAHLLLRGYWVGLVCLNYIFPQGIAPSKHQLQAPFQEKYLVGDNLQTQIIQIDRYAGLLMFLSVVTTTLIGGLLLASIITITLVDLLLPTTLKPFYNTTWEILFALYCFDLFAFGLLRKIKVISWLMYPLFWLLDKLTLRNINQKALRLFGSNIQTWQLFYILIPWFTLSLLLTYFHIYRDFRLPNIFDSRAFHKNLAPPNQQLYPLHYMDVAKASNKKITTPAIQSQVVTGNYLKIFLPYNKRWDEVYRALPKKDSSPYMADLVSVHLNDSLINHLKWYHYHALEIEQIGLYAMVNLQKLPPGKYELKISHPANGMNPTLIHFWKDNDGASD